MTSIRGSPRSSLDYQRVMPISNSDRQSILPVSDMHGYIPDRNQGTTTRTLPFLDVHKSSDFENTLGTPVLIKIDRDNNVMFVFKTKSLKAVERYYDEIKQAYPNKLPVPFLYKTIEQSPNISLLESTSTLLQKPCDAFYKTVVVMKSMAVAMNDLMKTNNLPMHDLYMDHTGGQYAELVKAQENTLSRTLVLNHINLNEFAVPKRTMPEMYGDLDSLSLLWKDPKGVIGGLRQLYKLGVNFYSWITLSDDDLLDPRLYLGIALRKVESVLYPGVVVAGVPIDSKPIETSVGEKAYRVIGEFVNDMLRNVYELQVFMVLGELSVISDDYMSAPLYLVDGPVVVGGVASVAFRDLTLYYKRFVKFMHNVLWMMVFVAYLENNLTMKAKSKSDVDTEVTVLKAFVYKYLDNRIQVTFSEIKSSL